MSVVGNLLLEVKLPRYAHLAKLHEAQGQYAEADAAYQILADALTRTRGAEHPDVATTVYQLARLNAEHEFEHGPETEVHYQTFGRGGVIEMFYRQALDIRSKTLDGAHRDLAESLYGMGVLHLLKRRPQEATPLLRRAVEIHRAAAGARDRDLALSLNALADAHRETGDPRAALSFFSAALEVHRGAQRNEGRIDEAARLTRAAEAHLEAGDRFEDAVAALNQAQQLHHAHLGDAYFEMTYRILGKPGAGAPIVVMILDLHRTLFLRESRAALLATLNGLAAVHQTLGDAGAALPYLKEALEVQRTLA